MLLHSLIILKLMYPIKDFTVVIKVNFMFEHLVTND